MTEDELWADAVNGDVVRLMHTGGTGTIVGRATLADDSRVLIVTIDGDRAPAPRAVYLKEVDGLVQRIVRPRETRVEPVERN
jgi:hypothetical protein